MSKTVIEVEDLQEKFSDRFPMISDMIGSRIAGMQIGSSNYERDQDFESMKDIDNECNKLVAEYDSLVHESINL